MGQRTDFNKLTIKQFLATAEINIEDQLIVWMTGFKRYVATFAPGCLWCNLCSGKEGEEDAEADLQESQDFDEFED
jgi:hypothetical protein